MSKRELSPAYQWYPRDFLSSSFVASLSPEQECAYRRLLDYQWLDGSIPDDISSLGHMTRLSRVKMERAWAILRHKFLPQPGEPGRLVNPRLEEERAVQQARREQARDAGIKSGEARARTAARNRIEGGSNGKATPVERPLNEKANETQPLRPLPPSSSSSSVLASSPAAPEPKQPHPARQFTDGWAALFLKHRSGTAYDFEGGKDGGHVKAILKLASDDVGEALRRAEVHLTDPYWSEHGANIGTLRSQWNRCVQVATNGNGKRNDKVGHALPSTKEEFKNGRVEI